MGDPRLNSMHLDANRRAMFREAREALVNAIGQQTICAEREAHESGTIIRNPKGKTPANLECWLVDNEFVYPLKVGINTVGRSNENDVVVEDAYVSRRHCAILVHRNQLCELHDTASKNGTLVNGARLDGPTPLKSGDEIRICDRQFVFLTRQGQASATPSVPASSGPVGQPPSCPAPPCSPSRTISS